MKTKDLAKQLLAEMEQELMGDDPRLEYIALKHEDLAKAGDVWAREGVIAIVEDVTDDGIVTVYSPNLHVTHKSLAKKLFERGELIYRKGSTDKTVKDPICPNCGKDHTNDFNETNEEFLARIAEH